MTTRAEDFGKLWGFTDFCEVLRQFEVAVEDQSYRIRILKTSHPKLKFSADCWETRQVALAHANMSDGASVEVFVKVSDFESAACLSEAAAVKLAFEFLARRTGARVHSEMAFA